MKRQYRWYSSARSVEVIFFLTTIRFKRNARSLAKLMRRCPYSYSVTMYMNLTLSPSSSAVWMMSS